MFELPSKTPNFGQVMTFSGAKQTPHLVRCPGNLFIIMFNSLGWEGIYEHPEYFELVTYDIFYTYAWPLRGIEET